MKTREELEAKLKELRKEERKIQKELGEVAKKAFKVGYKELFEKYPDLKSFSWTQYTPYFNDGDPCYFGSWHQEAECVLINGEELKEVCKKKRRWHLIESVWCAEKKGEYRTWGDKSLIYKEEEYEPGHYEVAMKVSKLYEPVLEFLSQFRDEDMEEMFGDHVEVTVTLDGVYKEHFDHD